MKKNTGILRTMIRLAKDNPTRLSAQLLGFLAHTLRQGWRHEHDTRNTHSAHGHAHIQILTTSNTQHMHGHHRVSWVVTTKNCSKHGACCGTHHNR